MEPETSDRHLDDLALDAVRAGDAPAENTGHAAGCSLCQERIATLRNLAERLSADATAVKVPAARDAAILDLAASAARRVRRRRLLLVAIPAVAAAAVLVIALLFRGGAASPGSQSDMPEVATKPGDVNRDDKVDILDAFTLSRAIESEGRTNPEWDFNHDQVIDATDVEALAQLAVSISAAIEGSPL